MNNNKKQQNIQSEKTLTEIFKYKTAEGPSEYHIMIHSTRPEDTYEEQLNAVLNTYDNLLAKELKGGVAVFKRYFLSDAANQADTLLGQLADETVGSTEPNNRKDAIDALTALGYSSMDAAKAVKQADPNADMDAEDILKAALKYLM